MTPFSKAQSSQSTCSTIEQERPTILGQVLHSSDSNAPLQSPSETITHPLSSSPHLATSNNMRTAITNSARNQNQKSHGSDSANSEGNPPPFLVTGHSDDSSHGNDSHNSNKIPHPLMHCQHRYEPHPNYQLPNQPNCRQEYTEQMVTGISSSFPTLPFHSHQELSLAERSIKKLVRNSQFFPPRAASSDWFRRPIQVDEPPPAARKLNRGSEVGRDWFHRSVQDEEILTKKQETKSEERAIAQVAPHVTTLYEHEIHVRELLGRGGFCEVRLAHIKNGNSSNNCHNGDDCTSQHQIYAIKYLSPTITKRKSKKAFSRGAADLVIEARFLSLLSHDNIIRLHHVSAGSLRENYNCLDTNEHHHEGCHLHSSQGSNSNTACNCDDHHGPGFNTKLRHFGYFLILDHLHETLDHRIKHTYIPEVEFMTGESPNKHHENHRCANCSHSMENIGCPQRRWLNNLPQWMQHHNAAFVSSKNGDPCAQTMKTWLAKRLIILRCIASAVKYLHDHHIIFRDLKPDNIGFAWDRRSIVPETKEIPKLFDFGLVKEMKVSSRVTSVTCHENLEHALYKLTGRTGSRRYMSPEVAFSQPYNQKVDIYSFGVLLYEMATLVQPFDGYTIHRHEIEVLRSGCRPCCLGYTYWPKDLARLIDECWAGDMRDRPNIEQVIERLDDCIHELSMTETCDEQHQKMTAKSLLVGISQMQLSSKEAPSSTRSNTTDEQSKGRSKMKSLLGSVPVSLPGLIRRNMNMAPQA